MAQTEFRPAEGQRLDAFVDAAFAFAVSLLIISSGQSAASFNDLMLALLRIPAFLGGFALIVLFWIAHRTWSTLGPARDGWATLLSLAVVFTILVFVFPLRLLIESAAHFLSGGRLPGVGLITSLDQLGWTYFIYGLGFSILSGLFALLFRHAERTVDDPARKLAARQWVRSWGLAFVAGVLSGVVALTPALRAAPWLPGCLYWVIPAGIGMFAWLDKRRKA
ncbi:MAG: DUF1211 domain-containing protein [Brevundimonas sp.]|nr:MAG: DUF1211 domain-containing protein [Brevundimonas sp.]